MMKISELEALSFEDMILFIDAMKMIFPLQTNRSSSVVHCEPDESGTEKILSSFEDDLARRSRQ